MDRITYEPDPFLPLPEDGPLPEARINRVLMTDYGNKANYRLGEEVQISVFSESYTDLAMEAPDGVITFFPVVDGKCTLRPTFSSSMRPHNRHRFAHLLHPQRAHPPRRNRRHAPPDGRRQRHGSD